MCTSTAIPNSTSAPFCVAFTVFCVVISFCKVPCKSFLSVFVQKADRIAFLETWNQYCVWRERFEWLKIKRKVQRRQLVSSWKLIVFRVVCVAVVIFFVFFFLFFLFFFIFYSRSKEESRKTENLLGLLLPREISRGHLMTSRRTPDMTYLQMSLIAPKFVTWRSHWA